MKSKSLYIIICCMLSCFILNTVKAQATIDQCFNAVLINSTTTCTEYFNEGTEFTGPQNNCTVDSVGSLWFKYHMVQAGRLKINTQQDFYLDQTNFNDIITVYRNSCNNLVEVGCYNEDQFGFTGERIFTDQLNAGDTTWIRISGAQDLFGKCSGKVCLEVQVAGQNEGLPPAEDNCASAASITPNQPCIAGTNINATSDFVVPSNYQNSSHCVWYSFAPTTASEFSINTNADFSEIITLWTGSCTGSMQEIASTDIGQTLLSPTLVAGQTYYVQLCGAFSSIEGNFCLEVTDSRAVTVNVSTLLEGAWDDNIGSMRTELWQNDLLPPGQPYNASPWNYSGTEGAGWTMADYPSFSVDWVLVSLRDPLHTVVNQAAGVLLEDGTIELLNPMRVSGSITQVYVMVEHRNHLPILSSIKVPIVNNELAYDFTLSNSFEGGAAGQKNINGVWMMYAGNVDQSNPAGYEITAADRIIWDNENGMFNIYSGADFNLDRDITGADRILWQSNNGTFSNVPKSN